MKVSIENRSNQPRLFSSRVPIVMLLTFALFACEDFLEVSPPKSKITEEIVFSDEATATAALLGIYYKMYSSQKFAGGDSRSVMGLTGLSGDELTNFPKTDQVIVQFENNDLQVENDYVSGLWNSLYETTYQANGVLEGLSISSNLGTSIKEQLQGEALFVRAFCHFYLVNLFGDIPLVTSTDYRINSSISRIPAEKVYQQIVRDLENAIALLPEAYAAPERIRPNKFTAVALLSRVYLYQKDWSKAEEQATRIINNSSLYSLKSNVNDVFLANSSEAIWQLRPPGPAASYTSEGWIFSLSNAIRNNILRDDFVNSFEIGDARMSNWIAAHDASGQTVYLPYKYKRSTTGPLTEYSMVFRLAEQYLIRSEARAEQNNIAGAQQDLNTIRTRANLTASDASDKTSLLAAIDQERKVELFAEWGHRWLDLKRTGRAGILSQIKTGFTQEDTLFPIPQAERDKNPNLDQNPGY